MINRDDIEAGDKCFTRDGGCLVAYDDCGLSLANLLIDAWLDDGTFYHGRTHPLDIIRIEKAPKPVVEEVYLGLDDGEWKVVYNPHHWDKSFKLTIINGKLEKAEQVK